jgi:hypothetical protein
MSTKKTTKNGAAKAAPDEPGDSMSVRSVSIRLPPFVDEEAGERHTVTINVHFYESQAAFLVGDATAVEGSDFRVSRRGFECRLPSGHRFGIGGERHEEVATALGLLDELPAAGPRAVALIPAFHHGELNLLRAHGRRGKGKSNRDHRDGLIAEVLVRIYRGASWRKAVAATLDAHCETELDDASLLAAVKRSMR